MANFVVLAAALLVGVWLRARRKIPENAPTTLNALIITVCLPALALTKMHGADLGPHALVPALMPWLFFALATTLFSVAARLAGWDDKTWGALLLTGAFGNTSFVGFPVIEALYGPQSLAIGVLVDQPGSFLALSTVGFGAALRSAQRVRRSRFEALGRVLSFPPFIALALALVLRPMAFPGWLDGALERLASPLAPLAMLSVGAQLRLSRSAIASRLGPLAFGLFVKLLLVPAIFFASVWLVAPKIEPQTLRVTLLETTMGPMISGAIIAGEYGLDAELANLMVSIGIPLSLGLVPFWALLIRKLVP